MIDFIAPVLFSGAFGLSVWTIWSTVRDNLPRIIEVMSYDFY